MNKKLSTFLPLFSAFHEAFEDEIRQIIQDEVGKLIEQLYREGVLMKKEIDDWGGIELAMEVTKLKKQTIYALTCSEKIPYYKKGKKLYFSRSELLIWIKSDAFRNIN